MNCPHCNSDNTARAKAIWQYGTQQTTTTGMYTHGKTSVPFTRTATTQTALAKQMSPPAQSSPGFVVFLGALVAGVLLFAGSNESIPVAALVPLLLILGFIVWFFAKSASDYNQKTFPQEMQQWEKKWFCRNCGREFFEA